MANVPPVVPQARSAKPGRVARLSIATATPLEARAKLTRAVKSFILIFVWMILRDQGRS